MSRGGVSHTRVRLFKLAANRGIGEEVDIIYDAKHIGSAVFANDSGGAYWTLPINHPSNKQCIPLLRHYKIERFNHDTDTYNLVGAGLLMSADVTNDEIVYNGSDYMSLLDMHYTPVLGASQYATSPLSYPAGSTKPIIVTGSAPLTATRSASAIRTTTGGTNQSSIAADWNSNDTEQHLPVGHWGVIQSGSAYYKSRSAIKFDLSASSDWTNATTITKAELRLYMTGAGTSPSGHVVKNAGSSRTLRITTLASDIWSDTTAGSEGSWANVTPSSSDLWGATNTDEVTRVFSNGTHTNETLIAIDITSIAQKWKAGTLTNHGIRLATGKGAATSTTSSNASFIDRENTLNCGLEFYSTAHTKAAVRPQLYIEFQKITNSSNGNYDSEGMFAAQQDAKAYLDKSRCQSPLGDLVANSSTNDAGRGQPALPRTPQAVYITSKSRKDGAATDNDVNRIDCTFDEANQKYVIKGYLQYERVDNAGSAVDFTQFYDYVNGNLAIDPNLGTAGSLSSRIKSADIIIETSPGGIAFAVRAWSPAWGECYGANDAYSVEIPFHFEVYKSGSITADIDKSSASAPAISSTDVWTANVAGISYFPMPSTPMYKIPILAVDGQSYEFSAYAVVKLNNTVGTEIVSSSSATALQSSSPMALRSETMQTIFSRFLTDAGGAFNIASIDGVTVGRLNWATIENVEPGAVWPSNTIRYFTSGEQITTFLRNICEKQMNVNDSVTVDAVSLPDRSLFNFVGIRRANGTPADGSKLFVHPTMNADDANITALVELNYPGEIGNFRYVYDGRVLRNSVQVIASTPFLTGTYTNMVGVRLQGASKNDSASMKEYGMAPLLYAQSGFLDSAEAELESQRTLEQRRDLNVASAMTVQLERDAINPFADIFLGDAIKINVRRDGIAPYEPDKNPYTNLVSTVFVVSGIIYKYAPDGSEDVQFQLLSGKYFAAARNALSTLSGGTMNSTQANIIQPVTNRVGSLKV